MTTASHFTNALADLWRQARTWLADALTDFRGPAAIAATLAREARAAIRVRLALIESLVMKLLLIEAAQTPPSSPASGGGRELPRKREEREGRVPTPPSVSRCALDISPQSGEHKHAAHRSEDPTRPETWRVRFRLRMPPQPRPRAVRSTRLSLQPRPDSVRAQAHARRLARRLEALRRVIADPRAAVAALARKLAALGPAARAAARRIALARPWRCAAPGSAFATAMVFGHDASFCFPIDTS